MKLKRPVLLTCTSRSLKPLKPSGNTAYYTYTVTRGWCLFLTKHHHCSKYSNIKYIWHCLTLTLLLHTENKNKIKSNQKKGRIISQKSTRWQCLYPTRLASRREGESEGVQKSHQRTSFIFMSSSLTLTFSTITLLLLGKLLPN